MENKKTKLTISGNPKKSFFVATYKKYTNFGLQKHIINCNITNSSLRENRISTFEYTIPRLGDLLLDTFFVSGLVMNPHLLISLRNSECFEKLIELKAPKP